MIQATRNDSDGRVDTGTFAIVCPRRTGECSTAEPPPRRLSEWTRSNTFLTADRRAQHVRTSRPESPLDLLMGARYYVWRRNRRDPLCQPIMQRQAVAALPQVRLRGQDTRSLALTGLAARFPGQRLVVLAELHVHPKDLARASSELAGHHSGPLVVSISDVDGAVLRAGGIRWLLTAPCEGLGSARGQQTHQHLLAHCPVETLTPGHTLRPDVPIGNPQLFLLDLHGCSELD